MVDTPLASLSLTHVHYNPKDPISYICAWLALIPQGLCVTYITLIWATREIEIILMFIGQMGCEAFNFLLKRLIKEERPRQMYGKGYGMPSSHAQFLTFFSVSISLFLLVRHTNSNPAAATPLVLRLLFSVLTLMTAALVAASRVYLNYHTPKQVLIGCAAGFVTAIAWFFVTGIARRRGWIDYALNTDIATLFRIRDLVIDEDLVEAGWRDWDRRPRRREYHKRTSKANGAGEAKQL